MKKTVLLMAVALFAMACGLAEANLVNLNCTKDTYVQDGTDAGTNFGASNQMKVGTGTLAGQTRYAYMAFSMIPLSGIATSDIQSAKLKLHWAGSVPAVKNGMIDRPGFSWAENTLTFNNQGTAFANGAATWSSTFTQTTGYNIEVDLTSIVKNWKDGLLVNNGIRFRYSGTTYSLLIVDPKEETTRSLPPIIEVTYIPEPATMGLLALGGLLFARKK